MKQIQGPGSEKQREQAIRRIRAKNGFKIHVVVYVMVNAILVFNWLVLTPARQSHGNGAGLPVGFFWPLFPIVIWGIFVAMHGYFAYRSTIYPEEQIQREIQKLS